MFGHKFSTLLQWKSKKCLTPPVEYILVREESNIIIPKERPLSHISFKVNWNLKIAEVQVHTGGPVDKGLLIITTQQGPVVWKSINANPGLNNNRAFQFSPSKSPSQS